MYGITLKQNISPVNMLDKTFTNVTADFDVVLKEPTNFFKPTFILQNHSGVNLNDFNYIDGSTSFSGRKYFIKEVKSIGYNRFEISAETDVLSTWASEIRANTAVVRRQENVYNLYLDDPDFHVYNYEKIQTLQFPENTFMKDLQYVVVTNGEVLHDTTEELSSQLENREGVKENGD